MKKWKFDLFNFKQSLTLEQLEISTIVDRHLQHFDKYSEKEITYSLKESLKSYNYDKDVICLIESLETEIKGEGLLYELKDLYKKIERKDYGIMYREPLSKLLDIINKDTDEERMSEIINSLSLYDWVPEIKLFVLSLTSDPKDIKNMTSGGAKSHKVYTVVEEVEKGHIAYVGDRWFILGDNGIVEEAVLSDYFGGDDLATFQNIEQSLVNSYFEKDRLNFNIDDNLTIAVSLKGKVYINGDEIDKETSLENLFNSPIIPMLKKNYYVVIKSLVDNLDKITDLDVVVKITNITKPLTELFVFNFKNKLYLYSIDKRSTKT